MADSIVIESIHGTTVSNMKIAVCSHKMLLMLFPLIAPRQFLKKNMLKKSFRNEKDDGMDFAVNSAEVSSQLGNLFMDALKLAYDHRNFVDLMRVRLVCGRSRVRSSRPAKHSFLDLVMKTFPRPFSPFRWFKKGSCQLLMKECALSTGKLPTLYARSFRRRFFAFHHAVNHPHTNIILSWLSIPLVLKCAAELLKIGLQIQI